MDATKWIRFRKETTLPRDCNFKDVRAKLSKGFLFIVMPTKVAHQHLAPQENNNSEEAQKNNNNDNNRKKGSIWGVKIGKGRFLKVAVVVTAVVLVVAIARWAEVYRHPHDAANKEHHIHV